MNKEITCQCSDKEIAESFIEDVKAVEDLLPNNEMPKEQSAFIESVKKHELETTNMTKSEAQDFAFRVWQDKLWLKAYLGEVVTESYL